MKSFSQTPPQASRASRLYWNERCDVDDDARITTFSKLMGMQAVHIGNMIQCRRKNDMSGFFMDWTQLVTLNDKWVSLVMSPFRHSSYVDEARLDRLQRVASDMSQGYTSTIAELIINGNVSPRKLNDVIGAEARFFSAVLGTPTLTTKRVGSSNHIENETRKHWYDHTGSILTLMKAARPNVHLGEVYDDDSFHYAAANCIIHGKLLGSWLDAVFLDK